MSRDPALVACEAALVLWIVAVAAGAAGSRTAFAALAGLAAAVQLTGLVIFLRRIISRTRRRTGPQ